MALVPLSFLELFRPSGLPLSSFFPNLVLSAYHYSVFQQIGSVHMQECNSHISCEGFIPVSHFSFFNLILVGLQPTVASTPLPNTGGVQARQQQGQTQSSNDVEFSGKFKGLCLYFGRITRWGKRTGKINLKLPVLTFLKGLYTLIVTVLSADINNNLTFIRCTVFWDHSEAQIASKFGVLRPFKGADC